MPWTESLPESCARGGYSLSGGGSATRHRPVPAGEDHATGIQVDLSTIDFEKLRDEFAKKVRLKHATLQDIRQIVEDKLAQMVARNPQRMDYYKEYQAIIADYNREKDRATVEDTFVRLTQLASEMDEQSQRHVREGLSEDELALFDLLVKDNISKTDREKLKQASKKLLALLKERLATMPNWTRNAVTQADVQVMILDSLYSSLPRPPFTKEYWVKHTGAEISNPKKQTISKIKR